MVFVKIGKTPPRSKALLSSPEMLVKYLKPLIGTTFALTRQARTDGSKFRKLITTCLLSQHAPMPADIRDYKIVPPKAKGVPKLRAEYIDTYIVTSFTTYSGLGGTFANVASGSTEVCPPFNTSADADVPIVYVSLPIKLYKKFFS